MDGKFKCLYLKIETTKKCSRLDSNVISGQTLILLPQRTIEVVRKKPAPFSLSLSPSLFYSSRHRPSLRPFSAFLSFFHLPLSPFLRECRKFPVSVVSKRSASPTKTRGFATHRTVTNARLQLWLLESRHDVVVDHEDNVSFAAVTVPKNRYARACLRESADDQ